MLINFRFDNFSGASCPQKDSDIRKDALSKAVEELTVPDFTTVAIVGTITWKYLVQNIKLEKYAINITKYGTIVLILWAKHM